MSRRLAALAAAALTTAAVAAPAIAQSGGGGSSTTVTFTQLDKGSTFHFVDLPPRTKLVKGNPKKISAGDEFIITAPLADSGGARIGELRAVCVATHTTKQFNAAHALCNGDFTFTDGSSLVANVADLAVPTTNGAILGGTGQYANARGTFTSSNASNALVTVTLVK
jgi:hypothetical protein